MSRLSDLIRQAKATDSQLGADLEREFRALTKRRSFGLVFERHQPEAVELAGRPVRKGDKVHILPPRGSRSRGDQRLWAVTGFEGRGENRSAKLVEAGQVEEPESTVALVADLVVVAEFRDHIYPGLIETGRVERGGDKPFHTVINAENFHALEMLTYTHRHAIDAIYIDPPYNTGAKDWKYNNDYVESDDDYRHSKWLAMMERRLLIARELLAPNGALVVTIDEHEVHRLGVLLDDVLPEYSKQTVTIVNNPKGVTQGHLSRVEEYAFFCFPPGGKSYTCDDDLLTHREVSESKDGHVRPRWKGLLRSGDEARREDRPQMFYPIYIDPASGRILGSGVPLTADRAPDFTATSEGTPVWPIRKDGSLGRWGVGRETFDELLRLGFVALGRRDNRRNTWAVSYLSQQVRDELDEGLLAVLGRDPVTGTADVVFVDRESRKVRTVWHRSAHDAGANGTDLIGDLLGTNRSFPFPKSLYAVEDALRVLVRGKPDAVVLDFFAGSGTTAHAVMRLNRQDGGRRQCILVTNNEVSADEQTRLRREGLRAGDADWERLGICDFITKPRLTAAMTGKTPAGDPLSGDYKFNDEFPMSEGFEENAAFFTLTYEGPLSVAHHRAFARIAPMLWLRAGARGPIITEIGDKGWDLTNVYGVLDDLDTAARFVAEVKKAPDLAMVYIVTDDDLAFQMVCRELPKGVRPVQLYESYLRNFEINSGRFA